MAKAKAKSPSLAPMIEKTLSVLSIAEEPRTLPEEFNSSDGSVRLERVAQVESKDGVVSIPVRGTAKQWDHFDGFTINASFVHSETRNRDIWVFSPVANAQAFEDPDQF